MINWIKNLFSRKPKQEHDVELFNNDELYHALINTTLSMLGDDESYRMMYDDDIIMSMLLSNLDIEPTVDNVQILTKMLACNPRYAVIRSDTHKSLMDYFLGVSKILVIDPNAELLHIDLELYGEISFKTIENIENKHYETDVPGVYFIYINAL